MNLRCRRQGTQDCRCIPPITGKRNRQGGRQLQRKHPGIHFHRAWILVAGQSLNNFLRLPVVKHVHDVAVSKRMRCHRNRKMHPVSFGPFHRLLQPVTHGFIGDGPQWFAPAGTGGHHPAFHLTHKIPVRQRNQPHFILGRAPAARGLSDNTRTNGRSPSKSNDSGVSILASPIRMPVFHMVANSIWWR